MPSPAPHTAALALVALLAGAATAQRPAALGPADGFGLPALDTGRVRAGLAAPDFTLESLAGGRVTLSQFRDRKSVILVFYRGHW